MGTIPLRVRRNCSEWYLCALCHRHILPGQEHFPLPEIGRYLHSECARAALVQMIPLREKRMSIPDAPQHGKAASNIPNWLILKYRGEICP